MKFFKNKKGEFAVSEIGKIVFAVFILIVLIAVVIILYKGSGGEILDAIKNMLRFGR